MLEFKNVQKIYSNAQIGPLNLTIEDNNYVSLVGKSGAGKTTIVKMVTNVINDYEGEILLDGKKITKDDFSYVTQKTMLFNHLTILENLELLNLNLEDLDEVLKFLGLPEDTKYRYPFEISGGQAQRVNFAKVLLEENKLVLLDEAFSSLDINIKDEIYDLIYTIKKEKKLIILAVTHDIEEAILLSDEILLLENGKVKFKGNSKAFIEQKNEAIDNFVSAKRKKLLQGLVQ